MSEILSIIFAAALICCLISSRLKAKKDYGNLYFAAESMYHDLIALGQSVPEEAARLFGKKNK